MTIIGRAVFVKSPSLQMINVNTGNTKFTSVNGVLFNKTKEILFQYSIGNHSTSYNVPYSVNTIGGNSFSNI